MYHRNPHRETSSHPFASVLFRHFALAAAVIVTAFAPSYAQGGPAGDELQVNSSTVDSQDHPALAFTPDGGFLAVWQSRQGSSGYDVYGQRFDASGAEVGPELRINSHVDGNQLEPRVGVDADGNFVVTWYSSTSSGTDDDQHSIQARLFAADGTPFGDDFQVNAYTAGFQGQPDVAVTPDGDFVVAWWSNGSFGDDDSGASIQARLFTATGTPLGEEFQLNFHTELDQKRPAVDLADDGSFVVAWQSLLQDGSGDAVIATRFDANGVPLTGEIQVNETTELFQSSPAVASAGDGDFVVTWQSEEQDGSSNGVFARRFDASGAALGSELQVDTYTSGPQEEPAVAQLGGGDFVIVWQSMGSDGSDDEAFSIRGRLYGADGTPDGPPFQVNVYTNLSQAHPAVAGGDDTRFTVVWDSDQQDGDDDGVFARRYAEIRLFADGFESGDLSAWDGVVQ